MVLEPINIKFQNCPYCSKLISAVALKCKYCKRDLEKYYIKIGKHKIEKNKERIFFNLK